MELLVNRAQVFPIHVGIDLGGAEVGVSQHLLHGTEVGAAFEEMSGKAVPEGVGRDPAGDAGFVGDALDDAPGANS